MLLEFGVLIKLESFGPALFQAVLYVCACLLPCVVGMPVTMD